MTPQEAVASLRSDLPFLHSRGIRYGLGQDNDPDWTPRILISDDPAKGCDFGMAMDALPALTTESNSGVPMMFTNYIDPQVYETLFAPIKVAEALGGEVQKGAWTDVSAMFPVDEFTGETSSYDDYSNAGMSGANMNWPQREAYLLQTVIGYGELETARAALARWNIVASKERSAASNLARFVNFSYAFGIRGLQNYGTTNDPNLSASLLPAVKAAGGTAWFRNGVVVATANEIITDFQTIITQLINQGNGQIDSQTPMTAVYAAVLDSALNTVNAFNVVVRNVLKELYPNMKLVSGVQQYGGTSASNPQGIAAGNLLQIIANEVEGQKAGFCAYNEKMRAHPIVRELSAFRQKKTSGTWGAILRMPFCISSMYGL